MVSQTVLPNPATYPEAELAKWREAGLELRPLKLILDVVEALGRKGGKPEAYVTNDELVSVVIPLAGAKAEVEPISDALMALRHGHLDLAGWPDCAPEANDRRLTREFLLFLANFGVLRLVDEGGRAQQRFYLDELAEGRVTVIDTQENIFLDDASASRAVEEIRHSPLPSIIERQRAQTMVLVRQGQSRFRSQVMADYGRRCLITGEAIPEVLEAAHIVPVSEGGADTSDNGFCLRVDVHRLFDSNNLRVGSDGTISLSEMASQSVSYGALPKTVELPNFVNPANVEWRSRYL